MPPMAQPIRVVAMIARTGRNALVLWGVENLAQDHADGQQRPQSGEDPNRGSTPKGFSTVSRQVFDTRAGRLQRVVRKWAGSSDFIARREIASRSPRALRVAKVSVWASTLFVIPRARGCNPMLSNWRKHARHPGALSPGKKNRRAVSGSFTNSKTGGPHSGRVPAGRSLNVGSG